MRPSTSGTIESQKGLTTSVLVILAIIVFEYMGVFYFYLPALRGLPIALGLAVVLFLVSITKNRFQDVLAYAQTKYLIVFIALTSIAILHGFLSTQALVIFKGQVGHFMLLVILALSLDNIKKFEVFCVSFILVHIAILSLNLDLLTSGLRMGSFTAGYFLGDGNDLSWSLVMILPLPLYLVLDKRKGKIKRATGLILFLAVLFAIVSLQSRGAALAVTGAMLYFWAFVTRRKLGAVILLAIMLAMVAVVAKPTYFSRMETIANYEEDTSAMGRIMAWKAAGKMAMDHPLLGVGAGSFNSVYGRHYRLPDAPANWISTHSVYFKILGEYGFVGVFVYLSILYYTFRSNWRLSKITEPIREGDSVFYLWPHILNMTLIAYSIAATFLSGFEYPHLFLIIGLSIAMDRLIRKEVGEEAVPAISNS